MRALYLMVAGAALAAFPPNANAQDRDDSFKWSSGIEAGRTVYVRNLNGSVHIESASGATAEVRAVKEWRRGDPKKVKITAEKTARGDILVCAVWEGQNTRCDEDGYRSEGSGSWWRDRNDNDVSVEFTILLPKGVKADASTVNGAPSPVAPCSPGSTRPPAPPSSSTKSLSLPIQTRSPTSAAKKDGPSA